MPNHLENYHQPTTDYVGPQPTPEITTAVAAIISIPNFCELPYAIWVFTFSTSACTTPIQIGRNRLLPQISWFSIESEEDQNPPHTLHLVVAKVQAPKKQTLW